MNKATLLIASLVFTFSLSAQQNQAELYKLENAKRQIKTGTVLTLSGIITTAVGTVMFVTGSGKKDPPTPGRINNDTYTSTSGVIGLGLMVTGPVLAILGIPNIIVGNIKKDRARSNLKITVITSKSFENSSRVTGIGVYFSF
jgi:hypothetical protein